jgi:hypothetical protein
MILYFPPPLATKNNEIVDGKKCTIPSISENCSLKVEIVKNGSPRGRRHPSKLAATTNSTHHSNSHRLHTTENRQNTRKER